MRESRHDNEVLCDIVKGIGQDLSGDERRELLIEALDLKNPDMRDAAGLGLAYLDDPFAIPALRSAVVNERLPELKRMQQKVLDQLEETLRVRVAHQLGDHPRKREETT